LIGAIRLSSLDKGVRDLNQDNPRQMKQVSGARDAVWQTEETLGSSGELGIYWAPALEVVLPW
jgi:hypothetical protein